MIYLPLRLQRVLKKVPGKLNAPGHWLAFKFQPQVLPEATPFMNPVDAICEQAPPRMMWTLHYYVIGLFFVVLLAAWAAKVDVVVSGSGSLTTATPPTILQPMERGIIRELRVKPGDSVKKGEVLAVLDPTFAHADLAAIQDQQRVSLAQIRRLEAELNDKPLDFGKAPSAEEALQYSLYQQRQEAYKSRLHIYDEDIQRLNAMIKTSEDDKVSLAKQVDYAKELESMKQALLASQNTSKVSFLDAQSVRARTERDYQDAIDHLTEAQHALLSKQAERQNFIDQWRDQALETLAAAKGESDKLTQSLSKASLINDLVVVTSPTDGVVLDVAKRSVGSIIRDAEPLVTIVPSDVPLVADIVVSSSDVGHIKQGDEVVVKVDAFPYQLHGLLKGRLSYVSEESYLMNEAGGEAQGAASLMHPGNGAVHRGRVELLTTELQHLPEGAHLIPGMTVSAEIKVGARSVLSFFIFPLTRGLSESLREP